MRRLSKRQKRGLSRELNSLRSGLLKKILLLGGIGLITFSLIYNYQTNFSKFAIEFGIGILLIILGLSRKNKINDQNIRTAFAHQDVKLRKRELKKIRKKY